MKKYLSIIILILINFISIYAITQHRPSDRAKYFSTFIPTVPSPPADGLPSGAIILIDSGSCPAEYTEVAGLVGQFLLGTNNVSSDVGTTGGNNNITPTGTVSQPTFIGDALGNHTHTFNGTPLGNHTHTFIGDAMAVHSHTITEVSNPKLWDTQAADTSPTIDDASAGTPTGTNSNESAGTPAGTNSNESAGIPSGTVSQPNFTGDSFDNRPAWTKVIFCKKD